MKRALAVSLLLLWPAAAQACSVCFSATEGNRIAFLVTTALLSFLPLILIGSGVLWLRHRHRQMEREAAPQPLADVTTPSMTTAPLSSQPTR